MPTYEFDIPERLRDRYGGAKTRRVTTAYADDPATLEVTWADGSKTKGGRLAFESLPEGYKAMFSARSGFLTMTHENPASQVWLIHASTAAALVDYLLAETTIHDLRTKWKNPFKYADTWGETSTSWPGYAAVAPEGVIDWPAAGFAFGTAELADRLSSGLPMGKPVIMKHLNDAKPTPTEAEKPQDVDPWDAAKDAERSLSEDTRPPRQPGEGYLAWLQRVYGGQPLAINPTPPFLPEAKIFRHFNDADTPETVLYGSTEIVLPHGHVLTTSSSTGSFDDVRIVSALPLVEAGGYDQARRPDGLVHPLSRVDQAKVIERDIAGSTTFLDWVKQAVDANAELHHGMSDTVVIHKDAFDRVNPPPPEPVDPKIEAVAEAICRSGSESCPWCSDGACMHQDEWLTEARAAVAAYEAATKPVMFTCANCHGAFPISERTVEIRANLGWGVCATCYGRNR